MKSSSLALACATLLLASTGFAQSAPTFQSTTSRSAMSVRDNPGALGHSYTDLHVTHENFRHSGADAYNAGLAGNVPIARGVDAGLGYDYYWENDQPGPIPGTNYDAHYHLLSTNANFYAPMNGVKPFLGGAVGYQWARTNFSAPVLSGPVHLSQHEWVWGAAAGVEMPMGAFAFTPRVTYTDTMSSNSIGGWHYGAEANHWFSERTGGYLDATFHDPKRGGGPESWTYTAGMRFRF